MPYTLEPYKTPSSRHTCPDCGSPRQFTRYINTETLEYLADHVGRCNREQNCAYHYTPKQYFHDHPEANPTLSHCHINKLSHSFSNSQIFKSPNHHSEIRDSAVLPSCSRVVVKSPSLPSPSLPVTPSSIPTHIFHQSLTSYSHNHLITWLSTHFDQSTINKLVNTYLIGTSKNWPGSTVFWQIDLHCNIRDGKIMLYNPTTGRRVKQPYNHITWAHSALKLKDYNLQQCFFGEHLLKLHPNKPVSIVESEKTAIISTVYFPQFIWLATGGKHGCKWSSNSVSKVLTGRHITLWPDIKAYDDWQTKSLELSKSGLQVSVSNLLEQVATESEREAGLDIADYLIRFKPDQFSKIIPNEPKLEVPIPIPKFTNPIFSNFQIFKSSNSINPFSNLQIPKSSNPFDRQTQSVMQTWDLDALESFFSSTLLPQPPIRLNQCSLILDLPKFISGHLAILHTYNGNPIFLPYLKRLQKLKQILES